MKSSYRSRCHSSHLACADFAYQVPCAAAAATFTVCCHCNEKVFDIISHFFFSFYFFLSLVVVFFFSHFQPLLVEFLLFFSCRYSKHDDSRGFVFFSLLFFAPITKHDMLSSLMYTLNKTDCMLLIIEMFLLVLSSIESMSQIY